jgi:CheY-like chemotaxis protein
LRESGTQLAAGHLVRPRILVVDDDEDVSEAVSSALVDEGYDVVVAQDGVEALSVLGRVPPPRLIVLDLTMPRMNGSEFRRRLGAELPQLAAIPVVVMSADVEGRVKARTLGAAAFLRKPIRLAELFRTVSEQLAARNVEPGA